jgi:thioester reductase-like protein
MSNEKNILITGVTGNLGSELLKSILLADKGRKTKLFLLIRAKNKNHAEERINNLFKFLFKSKYKSFLNSNIKVLIGDVSKVKFGLRNYDYDTLTRQIDLIYHAAASTRFQDPLPTQIISNVTGTKRILDLVAQSKKVVELHYISTVFVAGTFNGKFTENDFDVKQDFNNPYEKSKFEAEKIVREFSKKGRRVCIYRPSIIVGDYQSGAIINFQMFYKVLYLGSKGIFDEIPINKNTLVHIIPVNIAAQMIFILSKNINYEIDKKPVYHIMNPQVLNISRIINIISKYFHIKAPKLLDTTKKVLKNSTKNGLYGQFLYLFLSYLRFDTKITCQQTISRLKMLKYQPPVIDEIYIKKLLTYAVKTGYIK